jgi:endonuclease-8
VPEGDTIHYAANRMRPVLAGHVPDELRTLHPRFAADRWPERLADRAVRSVDARGKHLLIRFEGGLSIHSHLRMTGHWSVLDGGRRWPRSARRAWLVMRRAGSEVVEFDGPVLELMTDARVGNDPRIAHLGPDIIAADFDAERFLRRLREDDPTRPIGDALLDQQTIAGIGNLWKSEGCFAASVDPWRPAGRVRDDEAMAIVEALRPRMQYSAEHGFHQRDEQVYERAGRPCPRCGPESRILKRYQGDGNRKTFWCPACQT